MLVSALKRGDGSGTVLVLDAHLSGAFSVGADAATLRSAGVERIVALGDFSFEEGNVGSRNVVFVMRPLVSLARTVASLVAGVSVLGPSRQPHSLSLLFAPRRSLVCERVFADAGVSNLSIGELHLDLVALDADLLSLELHELAFRDLFLHKDPSHLYTAAKALMKIQALHGIIPKILTKGPNAQALAALMLRMRRELDVTVASAGAVFPPKCDIDSVIILDRSVDFATPLCMQLTYEGLVDEVFGIKTSFVQQGLLPKPASPAPEVSASMPTRTKKVALNPTTDKLYAQLRDLNFAIVGSVLKQNARKIQEEVESRHDAKTISQIKDFIGKLGGLEGDKAYLKLHTSIAEDITRRTQDHDFNRFLEIQQNILSGNIQASQTEYIEELMDKQAPIATTLRLMCLYSVVCGGIKTKVFELLRREFVQTYGIEHVKTLQNLQQVSLLTQNTSTSAFEAPLAAQLAGASAGSSAMRPSFAALRKPLHVIVDDIDEANPHDVAYVHSGYAPVSVRLVEAATATGRFGKAVTATLGAGVTWDGLEDVLKALPGMHGEAEQSLPDPHFVLRNEKSRKTTLVVFLGGCTFTEVASLRFLSRGKGESCRQFVTMTTSTITGTRMVESLIETVEKRLLDVNN
ncbi:Sec1-like protein [Chytriomyces sp. MP71]|nr:Sec1-like protein [Chytriomyces sp. MP71]